MLNLQENGKEKKESFLLLPPIACHRSNLHTIVETFAEKKCTPFLDLRFFLSSSSISGSITSIQDRVRLKWRHPLQTSVLLPILPSLCIFLFEVLLLLNGSNPRESLCVAVRHRSKMIVLHVSDRVLCYDCETERSQLMQFWDDASYIQTVHEGHLREVDVQLAAATPPCCINSPA